MKIKLIDYPGDIITICHKHQVLIEKWDEWGYTDCPIEDVWIVENNAPQL